MEQEGHHARPAPQGLQHHSSQDEVGVFEPIDVFKRLGYTKPWPNPTLLAMLERAHQPSVEQAFSAVKDQQENPSQNTWWR